MLKKFCLTIQNWHRCPQTEKYIVKTFVIWIAKSSFTWVWVAIVCSIARPQPGNQLLLCFMQAIIIHIFVNPKKTKLKLTKNNKTLKSNMEYVYYCLVYFVENRAKINVRDKAHGAIALHVSIIYIY